MTAVCYHDVKEKRSVRQKTKSVIAVRELDISQGVHCVLRRRRARRAGSTRSRKGRRKQIPTLPWEEFSGLERWKAKITG